MLFNDQRNVLCMSLYSYEKAFLPGEAYVFEETNVFLRSFYRWKMCV